MISKPPAPPDPRSTSAAQTGTSVSTSIANAMLANVDRRGPDGSTTFNQSGSFRWTDPFTNKTYTVPRFTENVQLSPQQQATYDQSKKAEFNLASLANEQSGFMRDYLADPFDLSNEATESRLFELGSKRLDPMFARQEESLRTNLANRGIREGSAAFSSAMDDFSRGRNDAFDNLLLTGRGQAVQEALTQRNQPINEISALLSGSQVAMPQFTGQQQPQIPITDNAGLISKNYDQRLQGWQMKNAGMQSILGGLFGLGSAFIMSDRRVKEDIVEVGETHDEQPIFAYRYKGSPMLQLGLVAQEVEKKHPEAVKEFGGIKHVNYQRALGLEAA